MLENRYGDPGDLVKTDTQVLRHVADVLAVMVFPGMGEDNADPRFPEDTLGIDLPIEEVLVLPKTEAFTRTLAISGRNAVSGDLRSAADIDVGPHATHQATVGKSFGDLVSGRASGTVTHRDGRVFYHVRRENEQTLARLRPAADDSQVLPFLQHDPARALGYYALPQSDDSHDPAVLEVAVGSPVVSSAVDCDFDLPGASHFLLSDPIAETGTRGGTARFASVAPSEGAPQLLGAIALFSQKAQAELRLTPMNPSRAAFQIGRGTRRVGQTYRLLVENPGAAPAQVMLAGLADDGRLTEVSTLQLEPGTHGFCMQYYFEPDTVIVVVERFNDAAPFHIASAQLESRIGVGVFDRVGVVNRTGPGFIGRCDEQPATGQINRQACFQEAVKMLGLVNRVNHGFICTED